MSGDNTSSTQPLGSDPSQTVFCQSCKEAYSYLYGEDCMPTALTCGHFLCFRCVKSQWSSPNSGDASVFCVECSAHMRISTFKWPQSAQGQAEGNQEVSADGTVQAVRQATCAGDGSDSLPIDRPMTAAQIPQPVCTPSKQYLPGQDQASTCPRESKDKVATQALYTLPPDRMLNQDDTWRLQNDEGFIRDWIVANVPDHVIFKMVGGGNQDASGVSNTDNFSGSVDGGGSLVSLLPRAANSVSSSTSVSNVPLPGMSSSLGDSTPRQAPEQQFWSYVINRANHNKHVHYVRENAELQPQHVPQLLEHAVQSGTQIEKQCLEEDEGLDKEAAPVTPQTAHGSPAPSISGVFPHHSREDMEKITAASGMEESGDCAMDTTGAARHAADASVAVEEPSQHIPPTVFAANPVVGMNEQKTAPGLGNTQYATNATQTVVSTTYSHVPAGTYSLLGRGFGSVEPSQPVFPQYKMPPAARQYRANPHYQEQLWDRSQESTVSHANYPSQRMYNHPDHTMGRPVRRMRPGSCFPYAYPYNCPYSQQQSGAQYYQQNWGWHHRHNLDYDPGYHVARTCPQRVRGWRARFGSSMPQFRSPAPCPWNSRAYTANVNLSPAEKVCNPPQLQVVQVVRQKPETLSDSETTTSSVPATATTVSEEASAAAEGTSVLPSSQTEAEVALMQTRDMPSGTKVEEIYVVPHVWLCDRLDDYASNERLALNPQHLLYEVGANIAVKEELTELAGAPGEDGPSVDQNENGKETVQGLSGEGEQDCDTSPAEMMESQSDQITCETTTSTQDDFSLSDFHPVAVLTSAPSAASGGQLAGSCMPQLISEAPAVMNSEQDLQHEQCISRIAAVGERAECVSAASVAGVSEAAEDMQMNREVTDPPAPQPLDQPEDAGHTSPGAQMTEVYAAVSSTGPDGGLVTDMIANGSAVTVLTGEKVLAVASKPGMQNLPRNTTEAEVEASGQQISCEQSTPSGMVNETVDASQQTPNVAGSGDVQILEEGSTCPSQILLALQNPMESPRKPRYRRNLADAFYNASRGMPQCTGVPPRGHSFYGRGRSRCGRRGRLRRGPCFQHVYHDIHPVADNLPGGGQYVFQQNPSAYGANGGYYQPTLNPAFQGSSLSQSYSSLLPSMPPPRPAAILGQQACTQQAFGVESEANQAMFSSSLPTHVQSSVPFGAQPQMTEQQPLQVQSPWMDEVRACPPSLTDPYPHLYVSSGRTQNAGVNPCLTSQNFGYQNLGHFTSQHQVVRGSGPRNELDRMSDGTLLAQGAAGVYAHRHWDSRPACPTGNMLMNNARGKKSHYSEVSACGDTGHLQQYLSAEDRQTDRGNTTVQWLLQQVTQLNDRLADTPDLRQLLGCLMLLSEVQGRLHDSSQPVDPLLIQQAQTSDMDCLLKSILGLGYDVVCCGRALCSRQVNNCQDGSGTLESSREIGHLVSSWFQYVVQQMNRMISFYLDHLCTMKPSNSSTPTKEQPQPAQGRLMQMYNPDPHKNGGVGALESKLSAAVGQHIQSDGRQNVTSTQAIGACLPSVVANSCPYKGGESLMSLTETSNRAHAAATNISTIDQYPEGQMGQMPVSYKEEICSLSVQSSGADFSFPCSTAASRVMSVGVLSAAPASDGHSKPAHNSYDPSSAIDEVYQKHLLGSVEFPKPQPLPCFQLEHSEALRRVSEEANIDETHVQSIGTQTTNQYEKSFVFEAHVADSACHISSDSGEDHGPPDSQVDSARDSYSEDLMAHISEDVRAACSFIVSAVSEMVGGQLSEHAASSRPLFGHIDQSVSAVPSPGFLSTSTADRTSGEIVLCLDQTVQQDKQSSTVLAAPEGHETGSYLSPQDVISDTAIVMSETVEVETEGLRDIDPRRGEQLLGCGLKDGLNTSQAVKENLESDWGHEDCRTLDHPQDRNLQQLDTDTEDQDKTDEQPVECGRRLRSRRAAWKFGTVEDVSPERARTMRSRKRMSNRKSQSVQTS
ncbi:hypothetical protein BaRGS_00011701 [Batillaria attramentaria]|uniref:RING-type domain-containing protein n=1 Tax=Batillaria attramentaria TaxID=370345 RepID=A0ABD0LC69_9CAEN